MDSNAWFRPPSCLQIVACLVVTCIQDCKKSSKFLLSEPKFVLNTRFTSIFCMKFHCWQRGYVCWWAFCRKQGGGDWNPSVEPCGLLGDACVEAQGWVVRRMHFHAFSIQVGEAIEAAEWEKSNVMSRALKMAENGSADNANHALLNWQQTFCSHVIVLWFTCIMEPCHHSVIFYQRFHFWILKGV